MAALLDQDHMRVNVNRVKATRKRLMAGLCELGFSVLPSETNFLWVKPPGIPAGEFFTRLRQRRILIRYFPEKQTSDFLRITVGTDEQAELLLQAAEAILDPNGS